MHAKLAWLKGHRILSLGLALMLICIVGIPLFVTLLFIPDQSYRTVVSSVASTTLLDIAKGQVLKMRVIPGVDSDEDFVVVIRQATRTGPNAWVSGYILKDCPKVSYPDVVRFKAPHSGSYEVAIKTRSGNPVGVLVRYFIGDQSESATAISQSLVQRLSRIQWLPFASPARPAPDPATGFPY